MSSAEGSYVGVSRFTHERSMSFGCSVAFAGARKSQSKMAAIHWPEAIGAVEQIASMQVDVQTT